MVKWARFLCTFFLLQQNAFGKRHNKTKQCEKHTFERAGVVTNSETCTDIALDILDDDGSAVDAAIAALVCEGITNPQSMGIGGGFIMTIFEASTREVHVLNAREVAPGGASPEMFDKIDTNATDGKDLSLSALAVAVPGELMGYWEAHKKFGKIGWYDLFRPSIDLASKGFPMIRYTADVIDSNKDDIYNSPSLTKLLTNPETNIFYKVGEEMPRTALADTLEVIALQGPKALYDGCLTGEFIQDISDNGGIITRNDLKNYKPIWQKPSAHSLGDYKIYTAGNPASGDLLLYILDVMASKLCNENTIFWHRLVETWKFAFGIRSKYSGKAMDPEKNAAVFDAQLADKIMNSIEDTCTSNNPKDYMEDITPAVQDHGTSHICVYAPNGDAVSVTSTINLSFGAMIVSESTGIILNNEMMDFSFPSRFYAKDNTKVNQIRPSHYPMSSMLPTIVVDQRNGQVRLVIGGAGGFKIITSTSFVTLQNLFMGVPLEDAIAAKRLHHQLTPMAIEFEAGFSEEIMTTLQGIGHLMQPMYGNGMWDNSSSAPFSCVNGISILNGFIFPVGDPRRNCYAGGL